MITICFTHFKTLTLANFAAALYSVRRQGLSQVDRVAVFDNDSAETEAQLQAAIDDLKFPVPVVLQSLKHGDATRRQAWSTNATVRMSAPTDWVFYTRSDYLLDFTILDKFLAVVEQKPAVWEGFLTSNGCHLSMDVAMCEFTQWRETGPRFQGVDYDYTSIDSGVWMARRYTYDRVGGFDERLSAWGHAQTEFQYRVHVAGVEFVRIPEVLFYHPQHVAERDMPLAHRQLRELGLDIQKMWERYEGAKFY